MQPLSWLSRSAVCSLAILIFTQTCQVKAEEPNVPRLVLIGDSTVKNGRGDGAGGLWGWGQVLADRFDTRRIEIENRALGGRSSRTYLTEGLWKRSLERLRLGDFVLMQFGHNDGGKFFTGNRPRGTIKGNGEETEDGVVEMTGKAETVHSYGWYLRRYIADSKAAGATPIVLSPVPRNLWREGHVVRAGDDYGKWAAEAAEQAGGQFIDLNEIIALRYEAIGEETVRRDVFTRADHTHTTEAGARVNAACVAEGIRHSGSELAKYLLPPQANRPDSDRQPIFRFDFGDGQLADSATRVLPTTVYSENNGYGFEPGASLKCIRYDVNDPLQQDACASDEPFYFSVALPEGNYRVTAVFGGGESGSCLTIKAELRRLMLENVVMAPGQFSTRQFTVNVRTPHLPDGRSVRLKDRERNSEAWAWDERLTLELNGVHPKLAALDIRPEPEAVTVYLAGDSTITDQPLEPWNSWGQMLPRFLKPGVAVANHAESGESVKSSLNARRFDKIFSLIKPGDYLFIQFGHNDMKDRDPGALAQYRKNIERLVERTRQRGAQPLLITSMERKGGLKEATLGGYPQVVRDVASEKQVPLIDLNAMSIELYRALGAGLDAAFQDGTHHTSYGSYLLAKCIVQGILDNKLKLAEFVVDDFSGFDPREPDSLTSFDVPASPRRDTTTPEGN